MSPKKTLLIITLLSLFIFGIDTKFASPELQTADTLTWVIIQTESGPRARTNHAMVQLQNGQILLFGGVDSNGTVLNDTWLYTPSQVSQSIRNKDHIINNVNKKQLADWTPITPPESPAARQGHTMVTLPDGRVLLYGGCDTQGAWFNDLHAFVADQWSLINPSNEPPSARANHNAWVRNVKLYVQGGFGPSLFEDFWRYDINTNQWEQLESPPDFISPHSFPMVIGGMIVFVDSHSFPYNDGKLFNYNTDQMLWGEQQLTNWPHNSISFYEMVQDGNNAYMLGGGTWDETLQKNIYSNKVWRFDYSSLSWLQETSMPYTVYDGTAVFDQFNDYITYWGGRVGDETFSPAENIIIGYRGSPPVSISTDEDLPTEFKLEQNYPNPFNGSTIISYVIPTPPLAPPLTKGKDMGGIVTLKVYNILGREVATLVNEYQQPGKYNIEFNVETRHGESLSSGVSSKGGYASGVYFYRLQAGNYSEIMKMVLLK